MGEKMESGVVPAGQPALRSNADIERGCDEIVSTATILMINMEFVWEKVDRGGNEALDDARAGVERIVEIAKAIRHFHRTQATLDRVGDPK